MKKSFVVERMDIVTRKVYPVDELFRIAKIDGKLIYDKDNNLGGRGYYLSKDLHVLELAAKRHSLDRISNDAAENNKILEELKNELSR